MGWSGVRRRLGAALVGSLWLAAAASAQTPGAAVQRESLRQALAREQAGDLAGAEEILHGVLSAQPADATALLALERVVRELRRLESLLPWLERAARAAPRSTLVRQTHLRVLGDLGRVPDLHAAGADWVRRSPREAAAYRDFALALEGVGRRDSALLVLESGRAALGGPPALATELADLYGRAGRWDDAVGEWLRLVREGTPFHRVVIERAAASAESAPSAVRALVDSLSAAATPPEQRTVAAIAALHLGEETRARAIATEAAAHLHPDVRRAFAEELVRAADRLDRPAAAAWSYALLLEGESNALDWGETALRVVRFDLERTDTASALHLLAEAMTRVPAGSTPHRNASALDVELAAAGRAPADARAALDRHAARYPRDRTLPALAAAVAHAEIRAGDLEAAEEVLDRFVPAGLADPAAVALVDGVRARIALYGGRWDDALERFRFVAAALTGPTRTHAIELAALLERASPAERAALADALRDVEAGRVADGAGRIAALPPASGPARPGLLLWAARHARAAALPLAPALLRAILSEHPQAAEAPAALLRLAEWTAEDPAGGAEAQALLERLILEYPSSALVPLARRRLDEIRARVPSS